MSKQPKAPVKPSDSTAIEEKIEINRLTLLVWGVRLSTYFLALGGIVLLAYAVKGFGTNPAKFPLGFRIDPVLASIYLALGAAGTLIGFFMQRFAASAPAGRQRPKISAASAMKPRPAVMFCVNVCRKPIERNAPPSAASPPEVMTALALLGSFGPETLRIQLSLRDTIFHWCAAALAWALWIYARGQAQKRLDSV